MDIKSTMFIQISVRWVYFTLWSQKRMLEENIGWAIEKMMRVLEATIEHAFGGIQKKEDTKIGLGNITSGEI